ncbi:HlyD family secretion protein [Rhodopseudomonas palustris]|nr:HlyD family secretion protein [Rhodopseudomonas palustris]WAB76996.1 HlyD family secretion protein [Rhodopseudomonas palustris]WCL94291.1 HlyD family secretion protein [Rhodopseudomonas palustris CGA009]WND50908.1 HlyD family secretion protein [Rhodopseudomonas palustris]
MLSNPWLRWGLITAAILLLLGGTGYGWYWWTTGSYFQSTNDAYLKADQVSIAPNVSGYLVGVPVVQNQTIAAGDQLAKIDDRSYRVRVEQAKAQLDQARAGKARAEAELNRQYAQIEQANAQLGQSEVSLAFAENQVARYRPLAASGAEATERYDQIRNQRDQARAQVALNNAQVESARRMVPSIEAQIAEAQAAIEQAEAQLHQAQIDLDNTVVVSPIAGRVGDLTARVGQFVQPGMRMMTVVPLHDLYLEANYKETQIGLMRVGQPATIEVDALPNEKLHGEVLSFSPGTGSEFSLLPPQNATGNFTKVVQRVPVRIRIDAGPEARKVLVPGLSIVVDVDTRNAKADIDRQRGELQDSRKAAQ